MTITIHCKDGSKQVVKPTNFFATDKNGGRLTPTKVKEYQDELAKSIALGNYKYHTVS